MQVHINAALAAENERLRRAVSFLAGYTANIETVAAPAWTYGLTPQELELIGILTKAYPRYLSNSQIETLLTKRRDTPTEFREKTVPVVVMRIRKKCGKDVIDSSIGRGYRINGELVG